MTMEFNRRALLSGLGFGAAALASPAWAKKKAKKGMAASAESLVHANLQTLLNDWVSSKRVPGAAASIGRGLELNQYFVAGTLGAGNPTKISPDSLFRAYSQTKPLTGMAAMILIEEGKLKLDQNIADFIPAFANPKVLTDPDKSLDARPATAPITVRNLLTHTAGLGYSIVTKGPLLDAYNKLGILPGQVSKRDLPGVPKFVTAPSLQEFADRLGTLPLVADPGVKWSYSVSLDLLGRVIEVASGMPFDVFLADRIFRPLGMTSTYFQVPASEVGRLTDNHFQLGGAAFPIDLAKESIYLDKPPFPFGGAGLVTSPRDWDQFQLMLMGEGAVGKTRIMKAETAKLAMSNILPPGATVDGFVKGQGFGAGGRVTIASGTNGEGIGTFGWGGAASTIGWVDRTKGLRASGWVQLMTQGEQRFPVELAKVIYGTKG
jgi:CubicO group peptidase (beta-lactamase class C family)